MDSPIKYFASVNDFRQLGKVKHKLENIKTASAKYFHEAVRSHWGIENKLHWCMDVIFGEDNSKKQAENSAQNFSLVNKIALNMIRNYKPDEARGSKKISMIRKRKMANRVNECLLDILFLFKTATQ